MTSAPAPVAPPSHLPSHLGRNRDFTLLWFGEGVSVLGTTTTSVLLPLLAVAHFRAGPGWMGALTAATWLPWLVVGLPAGAWVDRWRPRSVMLTCDVVAATAVATVPLAWAMGVLTLAHLALLALVGGVCAVFFRTAYVKLLPLVVADEHLERANARLFGTESAAQVAGPGVAGIVSQAVGAALGLLLDAVSFAVSAVCLSRIRPRDDVPTPAGHPSLSARIREGVAFLVGDTPLRWFTVLGALSNIGLTGYATLLVLFLVRDAAVPAAGVGLVLSLGSIGGLLGAAIATPLSGRLGSGRASTLLLVCSGPPALLVPLGGPGWRVGLTVLGLFLVGLGVVAGNVVRGSWTQRYIPRPLMGRVTTARQVVNFGAMPLAGLLAGALGSALGVRPAMLCLAAVHAAAGLSILASPMARLRLLPPAASPPDASSTVA